MLSTIPVVAALLVSLAVGYSSASATYNDNAIPQSRNMFQQIAINQMVNVLPQHIRDGIDDAAALFSMTRANFLLRCLKELQAFEKYSKIDFVNGLQRVVKFLDEQLTKEQQKELEKLEEPGIQIATLIFSNQLQSGQLNPVYDVMAKIYRKQIDAETFVKEIPQIVGGILMQALLSGIVVG